MKWFVLPVSTRSERHRQRHTQCKCAMEACIVAAQQSSYPVVRFFVVVDLLFQFCFILFAVGFMIAICVLVIEIERL